MSKELYKKHRPKSIKEVIGQETAISKLVNLMNELPQALLFTGPSGCGKTTLMRILKRELNCDGIDYMEINSADFRGIDDVRRIRQRMTLAPINGDCRIWAIDECHKLTNDAQNAMLKMLEDTPSHVYFFLATTDPQKLLTTVKTRCTPVEVKAVPATVLSELIDTVAKKEKVRIAEDARDLIVEASHGSPRQALVLLNQIYKLKPKKQTAVIQATYEKEEAIQLARLLIFQKPTWEQVVKVIRDVEEDAETLRWMILGYASSIMMNPKSKKMHARAYAVIDCFSEPYYNTKKAGLLMSCWEMINQ